MDGAASPARRGLAAAAVAGLALAGVARGMGRGLDSPCRCLEGGCQEGERVVAEVRIVRQPGPHIACEGGDVLLVLPPPPRSWQRGLDVAAQPGFPGADTVWGRPVSSAGVSGVWRGAALHVDVWLPHPWRGGKRLAAVVGLALWLFVSWRAVRTWPT